MNFWILSILVSILLYQTHSSIYLHSPRGSNNRNCERNENRNNQNFLFDSQNGPKGGYACPRAVGGPEIITPTVYYYAGSKLKVEWTTDYTCENCETILQYSCIEQSPGMRDGIPTDQNDAATDSLTQTNRDEARQASHEPFELWSRCNTRNKNSGLFFGNSISSNTSKATTTRQNLGSGAKYGWECPEERDYYPYWHYNTWKDIAVLTTNTSRCPFYQSESQNTKARGECWNTEGLSSYMSHNNEADCLANNLNWRSIPGWGISPPECLSHPVGTENLGQLYSYLWTIPSVVSSKCVLRIRYNVTSDIPWETDYKSNGLFPDHPIVNPGLNHSLQLAYNIHQDARTFQDRTFVFEIKANPLVGETIWNLGVSGKRGGIDKVFPALQYTFSPQTLPVLRGDYIHIQWTGSDYNPDRKPNQGEGGPVEDDGSARADRHNMVQLENLKATLMKNTSFGTLFTNELDLPDQDLINKFALINQPSLLIFNDTDPERCMEWIDLFIKNGNNSAGARLDRQNCMKLNNAPTPYFDGGLIRMRREGEFHYFSSRNNNPSNRIQKGSIVVSLLCYGKTSRDATVCSGRGSCITVNNCRCNAGYGGIQCEQITCNQIPANQSGVCAGNGVCIGIDTCQCNSGWTNKFCDQFTCSAQNNCGVNGICTGPNQCKCNEGYQGPNCNLITCFDSNHQTPGVCGGNGVCTAPNNCTCKDKFTGPQCSDWNCFGMKKSDKEACNTNGDCVGPDMCWCSSESMRKDCAPDSGQGRFTILFFIISLVFFSCGVIFITGAIVVLVYILTRRKGKPKGELEMPFMQNVFQK